MYWILLMSEWQLIQMTCLNIERSQKLNAQVWITTRTSRAYNLKGNCITHLPIGKGRRNPQSLEGRNGFLARTLGDYQDFLIRRDGKIVLSDSRLPVRFLYPSHMNCDHIAHKSGLARGRFHLPGSIGCQYAAGWVTELWNYNPEKHAVYS